VTTNGFSQLYPISMKIGKLVYACWVDETDLNAELLLVNASPAGLLGFCIDVVSVNLSQLREDCNAFSIELVVNSLSGCSQWPGGQALPYTSTGACRDGLLLRHCMAEA